MSQSYKKPRGAFELPIETATYVPSTDKKSTKISDDEYKERVREVEIYLSKTFGGKSSTEVRGGYQADDGSFIEEDITVVKAFAGRNAFKRNRAKLYKKIRSWGKKWGQEAMGLEIEGDLFYI